MLEITEPAPDMPPLMPSGFDTGAYRKAVALDLRLFAYLQGHEINQSAYLDLKSHPFGYRMALEPTSPPARQALEVIDKGWAILEAEEPQKIVDNLAADFASIYFTYKLRASPSESVWFDDENLMRQKPMFDIRNWYERYGMGAGDWQRRSDDHISLQLEFIAYLLDNPETEFVAAARFLDEHLLRWIGDFAQRVSTRCATPFYAGLVPLTSAYIEELRDVIEATTGYARPKPEPEDNELKEVLDEIQT